MAQNTLRTSNVPSTSWSEKVTVGESLLTTYQDQVEKIRQVLSQAKKVVIATHEHPDGDALGSSLALMHALHRAGKKVVAYIPDEAPVMFDFLPGVDELTCEKPNLSDFDVVVVLDATYIARSHLENEVIGHQQTVVIDHHYDNRGEAKINLVVPEAAATAHILTEFFSMTNTPVTTDMATCLLTGIFTDTGSFMHDSTTPEIMKLAAGLMNKGARLSHIAHETYQKKDLPGLRMWGRALSRIMTNETSGVVISVITAQDLSECGATLDDLAGVVNMLNTLPEGRFALLLCEYEEGKIKGSLRSEPHKGVDVSQIAQRMGGGGHKLAAGFEVPGHIIKDGERWRIIAPKGD